MTKRMKHGSGMKCRDERFHYLEKIPHDEYARKTSEGSHHTDVLKGPLLTTKKLLGLDDSSKCFVSDV